LAQPIHSGIVLYSMIRPFSLLVGLRYTRAKRRNHFISFISVVSMLGIALGVAVLITVLSVMNGFDSTIRTKFFSVAPAVTVTTTLRPDITWQSLQNIVLKQPEVTNAAPFVNGKGMLLNMGAVNGADIIGVIPKEQDKVSDISKKMVAGSLSSLQPRKYNMVIGKTLAANLGLVVGDQVNLFTPQSTTTPLGILPRYRRFTISGIFNTKSGFGFDSGVAYINYLDAQKLYAGGQATSGLYLKLNDIYAAPAITNKLNRELDTSYYVTNWTQQFGAFFEALSMEKTIMFVILMLIVGVAVFNLVSTLVMAVNDKRPDIAILRTIGATPRQIMSIFVIQGAVVGLIGTLLGVIGGVILALNATAIVNWVQYEFHVQLISSAVYFVNYLPSQLHFSDVLGVAIISFSLCLVATLYPAWTAARTQPAEALRYE